VQSAHEGRCIRAAWMSPSTHLQGEVRQTVQETTPNPDNAVSTTGGNPIRLLGEVYSRGETRV